jgi:hypothetical protein
MEKRLLTNIFRHISVNEINTAGDTVRPLHRANKLFLMATLKLGRHVGSCQNQ